MPQNLELKPQTREAVFMPETVDKEARTVRISWGTGAPVARYDWMRDEVFMEELSMDPSHIRMDRMNSGRSPFTRDHARGIDNVIGVITEAGIENGEGWAVVRFSDREDVEPIWRDVVSGILRNTSATYRTYAVERIRSENGPDTMLAVDWEPIAVGLVDVGADASAQVRGDEVAANAVRVFDNQTPTAATAAANEEEDRMDPEKKQPQEGGEINGVSDADAKRMASEAAAAAKREMQEVMSFCRSHGMEVDPAEAAGMTIETAKERALEWHLKRANEEHKEPEAPATSARLLVDQVDKVRAEADLFVAERAGMKGERKCAFRSSSYIDGAREFFVGLGMRDAWRWSRRDIAFAILGQVNNLSPDAQRDAANITTGSFPSFINLNAITKIVADGFENGGRGVNYQRWTEANTVPDFKQFSVGSLGTGNLVETAENVAFPELSKSEGVYNDTIKMWGGTLSLTLQALINDDTGEFNRSLRQAGLIAQKTVNRRAYQKLLMGTSTDTATSTWTNNTAVGSIQYTTADTAYGARKLLDDVIGSYLNKVGQDGNPLGNPPAILLCAPSLAGQARGITGAVAPGQVTTQGPTSGSIEVIDSPWLTTGSGLTGAASTTYYLLADPMEVTGMLVSTLSGMGSPQVQEYDAGAVAARKWKIWHAFECSLVSQANSAGTTIIAGAHQGTAS